MKGPADADMELGDWRRFTEAMLAAAAPAGSHVPLEQAGSAFARFAADVAALARPAASAPAVAREQFAAQLGAMADRFVPSAFPPWPTPPGAGAEWQRTLEAWSKVLAGIAADTARRFAARLLAPDPPETLRATFDAWIDAAEASFQASAHGDAFISAHARLINEFVRQKRTQLELTERAARAIGLPTRTEVDALHDRLRALDAQHKRTAAPVGGSKPSRAKQVATKRPARRNPRRRR